MKKRLFALLVTGIMTMSLLAGCTDEEWDEDWEEEYEDYEEGETEDSDKQNTGDQSSSSSAVRGLKMSVGGSSGELSITRAESSAEPKMGDEGVWTVFVYLCGTDLESYNGMGTGDFEEMMNSVPSDNVRFVVQTGGTAEWFIDGIDSEKIQRFVVTSGNMELVDETSEAGMGKPETLGDFIQWGTENYASEHMGLILWNHGGGSITGVCFDEKDNADSLSLAELDSALYDGFNASGRKFDFIGFDACLMGTVETANVLATYADYMYGSEETEPGSGWDYAEIGSYLAENPSADGAELGKVVCDSFLAACAAQNDDDLTTLSVIDLSKMDDFLVSFNTFAKEMYEAGEDASGRAQLVRGIEAADNFGGNNKSEGYTNMVDMGGIIDAGDGYAASAQAARQALDSVVVYSVTGSTHEGASGLAMYYPLSIEGSNELGIFGQVCISPYYLAFIDRQNQSGAGTLPDGGYDDSGLYDDEGEWTYGENEDDGYWDYMDDYEQTGESQYITFEQEPTLDENGTYYFQLDENGYNNAASVSALIYEVTEDGESMIELGETIDVNGDWDTGVFEDYFDGSWLSLSDGQNLAIYIADSTEDYVVYTSPITLNGEETNLRFKQYYADGTVEVEGAWEGIDENGAAARDVVKLKDGDVIVPIYYAYSMEGDDEFAFQGNEFTVSGNIEINYGLMESGDYLYAFCIDDIYGDYLVTDPVMFNVDENGDLSFYVDDEGNEAYDD
ncbi:MAG: Clostripain family protein [Lachnospiraceae bacterium]|nr:Clostripain family protein [Lachnospiraceae bacterium]